MEELLSNKSIEFIVILKEKEIVGYSIIRYTEIINMNLINDRYFAYMEEICIGGEHRGQGLGKILFNYCYDLVKDKGAEGLELGVWSFNKSAIEFYKSMGMVEMTIRMEKK